MKLYACDMVNGVTVGKILNLKHYLLGLGSHNFSGQKSLVRILNLLGHSVSYNTVCSVETALAEVSELHASLEPSSGLQPIAAGGFVHTFFWADNFDKKVKSDKI